MSVAVLSIPSFRFNRLAVNVIFFLNGFVHANYFARLPRIQEQFQINNGTMGLVLLSSSVGAILAFPFTGWQIIRNGSRKIAVFSVFFYCLLVPFIPLSPALWCLIIVFFLLGVTSGMLDVSMNAQAVMVERGYRKPIMTSFHAYFSIGMMLGALSGILFNKLESSLTEHLTWIAIGCLLIVLASKNYLIGDKPEKKEHAGPAFRLPDRTIISIGIIAFCCMLGEGAMADWSTNYMENITNAGKDFAPLGLSAFALAMTIGRLIGDRGRQKFGDQRLMVICGIIAIIGLLLVIGQVDSGIATLGFFIVGLGLSVIVPITYSIAGNRKNLPSGVGLAMVTTIGYTGFLFGPPIIGILADFFTLRYALGMVLLLFLTMTVLGYFYRASDDS